MNIDTIDGVNNITILGYITSMVITISIYLPPPIQVSEGTNEAD